MYTIVEAEVHGNRRDKSEVSDIVMRFLAARRYRKESAVPGISVTEGSSSDVG